MLATSLRAARTGLQQNTRNLMSRAGVHPDLIPHIDRVGREITKEHAFLTNELADKGRVDLRVRRLAGLRGALEKATVSPVGGRRGLVVTAENRIDQGTMTVVDYSGYRGTSLLGAAETLFSQVGNNGVNVFTNGSMNSFLPRATRNAYAEQVEQIDTVNDSEERDKLLAEKREQYSKEASSTALGAAETVRTGLNEGGDTVIHLWNAVDHVDLPSSAAPMLESLSPLLVNQAVMALLCQVVMDAKRLNPELHAPVMSGHSYGANALAYAFNLLEHSEVKDVLSLYLAPLGNPELNWAMTEVKQHRLGVPCVVRPGLDPIQEALEVIGAGISIDSVVQDVTLRMAGHSLRSMIDKLGGYMLSNGYGDIRQLIAEKNGTKARQVNVFYSSDGDREVSYTELPGRQNELTDGDSNRRDVTASLNKNSSSRNSTLEGKAGNSTSESLANSAAFRADSEDTKQSDDGGGKQNAARSPMLDKQRRTKRERERRTKTSRRK